MNIKDVPQDDRYFKDTQIRDICYAVDEAGNYHQVASVGWEPKNEALSLTWEHIKEEATTIKQDIVAGKRSNLAYYMKIRLLTVKMLSSHTGISKRLIKRHLKSQMLLQELDHPSLLKYAEALNIKVEALWT